MLCFFFGEEQVGKRKGSKSIVPWYGFHEAFQPAVAEMVCIQHSNNMWLDYRNFGMESLRIRFFTPLIIRDIWCGNAQVSMGKKSLQTSQLSTSKCAFMSKKLLYSLNTEKNTFIWFSLVCFVLITWKKCTFFPNVVVSRFEENSIIILVWLSWVLTVSW